jgi:hypothetical protein
MMGDDGSYVDQSHEWSILWWGVLPGINLPGG